MEPEPESKGLGVKKDRLSTNVQVESVVPSQLGGGLAWVGVNLAVRAPGTSKAKSTAPARPNIEHAGTRKLTIGDKDDSFRIGVDTPPGVRSRPRLCGSGGHDCAGPRL